jgi:hypothetical protein
MGVSDALSYPSMTGNVSSKDEFPVMKLHHGPVNASLQVG